MVYKTDIKLSIAEKHILLYLPLFSNFKLGHYPKTDPVVKISIMLYNWIKKGGKQDRNRSTRGCGYS